MIFCAILTFLLTIARSQITTNFKRLKQPVYPNIVIRLWLEEP